jgi:hypothetical protein
MQGLTIGLSLLITEVCWIFLQNMIPIHGPVVTQVIVAMNSGLTPIIYMIFSNDVRTAVICVFTGGKTNDEAIFV